MRLKASGFLLGLCFIVWAVGTPVSAGTLHGSEDTVSVGQTVVTAHVLAEETPPAEEEIDLPGKNPSGSEPSDSDSQDHEAQPGVHAKAVDTADVNAWEYMFLLCVFSGIVITAVKLRRLY